MSVPPDIMAALGGGAPEAGGLPPDIMAALGMPAEAEVADEPAPGALHGGAVADGNPEDEYREAIALLQAGIEEDNDEARIQTVLQCITKIQGELANSQKGMDSMMGGKMDPGTLRRSQAANTSY